MRPMEETKRINALVEMEIRKAATYDYMLNNIQNNMFCKILEPLQIQTATSTDIHCGCLNRGEKPLYSYVIKKC